MCDSDIKNAGAHRYVVSTCISIKQVCSIIYIILTPPTYCATMTAPPRGRRRRVVGSCFRLVSTFHGEEALPVSENIVSVGLFRRRRDQSTLMVRSLSLPLMAAMYHFVPLRRAMMT